LVKGEILLLEVKNLTVRYGPVVALSDASFGINEGEIVAMIGPNGAGKSTALNAISGMLHALDGVIDKGEILFEGRNIKGFRTYQLVAEGLSLVPEGRRVFPTMTVLENLEMGAYTRSDGETIKHEIEYILDLFPQLKTRLYNKAGILSTGEQQMLTIGRALMLKPKLLLADEPSLGLSPNYVELIFNKLIEINKNGVSILLVEQNARMALDVCHRGYVFEIGRIAFEGDREKLLENGKVKEAFLGS
jgi:branched-chain amino acid transport system ATP-binding protein